MHMECNNQCIWGSSCRNKAIQISTEKVTKLFVCNRNYEVGVLAGSNIRKGDFIIEYVGECFTRKSMLERKAKVVSKNHFPYWFKVSSNKYIDATFKGNNSRFINHSCSENADTEVYLVKGEERVGIFASRNINLGEEICINYNNRNTTYV